MPRIDVAEIPGEGGTGELGDRAGQLHAGRAGADDDEGQQRCSALLVRLAFRFLEGDQNAPPDRRGVLKRLQPRGVRLPVVVAEIGVARACSQHERVVGNDGTVIEQDLPGLLVDAGDGRQQGGDVWTVAQQMPDRPGDLGGGERSRRHLIEQRLEQMMVATVDDGDAHQSAAQPVDRLQPAEAGADYDNVLSRA